MAPPTSAPLAPLWLSHHYACDADRCAHVGSIPVCRRCLAMFAGFFPALAVLVSPWRNGLEAGDIGLVLAFTLVTPFGIVVGILSGGASPIAKLVLEGLGCGTFLYIGATEISSDEFEMTARACDEMHGASAAGRQAGDAEKAGHTHTHHSHEPPSRSARLLAFSAYGLGVFAILMSNFAPHAD